ncbi:related to HMG-box transcription factor [Ustilago trichophora]|uniref:Related to HMG-box transcription factor n=1 Tax=Ustilago trichophora TaxID=86804 RepID=A0A5C3EIE4_9BASI|nr:related to HMG-box transcription factor [Ustilago trichophora]
MAQQGHGLAPGPSRISQYDDRPVGQGRQEYDGMIVATTTQPEAFGRSAPYVHDGSLFPTSASSYDHTNTGLRADDSHSLLGMHSHQQNDSQSLSAYSDALPHQQSHYTPYTPSPQHISQSSQAYQPHQQHPQQHQHQHQHQHPHHLHHLHHHSDQHLGMQMPSNLVSSQTLGMHHAHSNDTHMHHHSEYAQGSLDGQRKAQTKGEAAEPHTPRPPNAWILYRSQKFREIQQTRDSQSRSGASEKPKSQAEISRIISQMWQNESTAVKQEFEALADEKKLAHQRMYPTYRYRPKKKVKSSKQSAATTAASQIDDRSEGHSIKREVQGAFTGPGYPDRYASESSSSTAYSSAADSKIGGSDPQRAAGSQGISSIHDLGGRELMSRKANNYVDRRDRVELQVPVNYGRSVSGSISSGEGHSVTSYSSNRLHPYGDRASSSSLMRQESLRASSDVFGDSQPHSGGTYTSSYWPDSDTMNGTSNTSNHFDGSRSGPNSFGSLGSTRLPAASHISNTAGGSSLLPLSPPTRQSVPSQQLQHHPIDSMDGNLSLAQLTGTPANTAYTGASSFRTTPLTNHTVRLGHTSLGSAGGERSEVPSGLAGIPHGGGGNDGLTDAFDPHRRMQLS